MSTQSSPVSLASPPSLSASGGALHGLARRLVRAPALLAALAAGLGVGLAALPACGTTTAGPCSDYCDYICDCHPDSGDTTCEDCRTVYTDDDAALQDECETTLTDLQNADQAAGVDCSTDTGASP